MAQNDLTQRALTALREVWQSQDTGNWHDDFVTEVNAILSCSMDNPPRHPDTERIDLLQEHYSAARADTHRSGTSVVVTSGPVLLWDERSPFGGDLRAAIDNDHNMNRTMTPRFTVSRVERLMSACEGEMGTAPSLAHAKRILHYVEYGTLPGEESAPTPDWRGSNIHHYPPTKAKIKPPPEKPKYIPYWPFCEKCHQPFTFDRNEPFAHCACGTTEWGDPRPAPWVPAPTTPGAIAYQLTQRMVIDMPTARASVDAAFAAINHATRDPEPTDWPKFILMARNWFGGDPGKALAELEHRVRFAGHDQPPAMALRKHREGWQFAEYVADMGQVDESLRAFTEDHTGDNGTFVVQAVINAAFPMLNPESLVPRTFAFEGATVPPEQYMDNLLESCANWLETRSQMSFASCEAGLMRIYAKNLRDLRKYLKTE